MKLELQRLEVGPWPMNCYLVRCPTNGPVAIVDPGADAETILTAVGAAPVACILLTHAHPDHIGALEAIYRATEAPVGVHPADAALYGVDADFPLMDGMQVEIGKGKVAIIHVPGHTLGSVCLMLGSEAVVGDAIFPGGPGHTTSPQALAQSLVSLGRTVFAWPDTTRLFPGHGGSTTVGAERPSFEAFVAFGPISDLHGDVSWRQGTA
jgi:hydroxyacylglutathione hydrolase